MPLSPWSLAVRRLLACLSGVLLLVLPMLAPAPAWAGSGQAATIAPVSSAFDQGPASSDQLALYARIASVNTCLATRAGETFEQAAGVAGETIAQLILGVHKGLIQSSGSTPLSLDELRKGSINAAVIGAAELCPKQVPADLNDKVRLALTSEGGAASS